MSKILLLFFMSLLASCASRPKCGNPEGSRTILAGTTSCQVRIRQVTIGSDLKIPESLKGSLTSNFALDWQESGLVNGRIELGHFVLIPLSSQMEAKP